MHTGKIHPHTILVPVKARISHIKERAHFTAKVAKGFNSKIFVLHTTKPITKFFHGEIHLAPAQWEEKLPANISDFIEQMKKSGVELDGKLSPGAAARNITIEAAAKRHDLIIMGASERGMLASFLKGNPVEEILGDTPCDLIILKPRHED